MQLLTARRPDIRKSEQDEANEVPRRVLIVEDEGLVAEDISTTLELLGYTVAGIASSGKEALHAAAHFSPDVVLMDIKIRGQMDGIEVAAIVAEQHKIPVVFLTSHSDEPMLARARAVAPYGYVLKPFGQRELRPAIEVALARHRLETELARARDELAKKSALLEAIIESMEDAVIAAEPNGNLLLANDAGIELIAAHSQHTGWTDSQVITSLLEEVFAGRSIRQSEQFITDPTYAQERWISTTAAPIDKRAAHIGAVAVCRDVTERKLRQLELERQSMIDELTGLYNLRGFHMLVEQQLKLAKRTASPLVLFFVDLDGLKAVNDTLGHEQGDVAIKDMAAVLRRCFREPDVLARIGGDEFVILGIGADVSRCEVIEGRIQKAIDEHNRTSPRNFKLAASIGACPWDPSDTRTIETFIAEADRLMYEQKRMRRAQNASRASR